MTAHHPLTWFPFNIAARKLQSRPHPPVVLKTRFFSSHQHLEKKELVHRNGDLGPSREKGGRRLVESYPTQCIDWKRERPCFFSFEKVTKEKSVEFR